MLVHQALVMESEGMRQEACKTKVARPIHSVRIRESQTYPRRFLFLILRDEFHLDEGQKETHKSLDPGFLIAWILTTRIGINSKQGRAKR